MQQDYSEVDTGQQQDQSSGDWFDTNAPAPVWTYPSGGTQPNTDPGEGKIPVPGVANPDGTPIYITPGTAGETMPGGGSVAGGGGFSFGGPIAPYSGSGTYPDIPIPDYLQQPFALPQMPGQLRTPYALPSMADLQATPGYEARYKMGFDARQRAAASQGTLLNGGTLQALTRYGQDYASGEYGNLVNQQLQARGENSSEYNNSVGQALAGRQQQVNDWQTLTNQPALNKYGSLYQQYMDLIGNNRNAQNDYTDALLRQAQIGATSAGAGNPGTGA